MKFYGIEERDGWVRIPGPVDIPLMDYTALVGLVDALNLKLDASAYTAADVLAKVLTVDGAGSGLDADTLDGLSSAAFLSAASYTAADVLAKLLTVDGSGSGLDADLLDGQSAAAFAAASHTHAQSDITGLAASLALKLDAADYTAADVLTKIKTVDGAGSGLDADTLDGISSAGFVAVGSYTAADVLSKLLTVDGTGSGLDADLLDGLSSASFGQTASASTIAAAWNFTTKQQVFGTTTANIALVTGLPDTGASVHVVEQIRLHRVNADPAIVQGRVNGSYASPTAVVNGNVLGNLFFGGYDGTTMQNASGAMWYESTENWSGSARGGRWRIQTTTPTTTTRADRVIIDHTGAQVNGNVQLSVAGNKMLIKEGSNASMGVATMVAGTVTVSNTLVTASSRIFLTIQSLGTVTAPKAIGVTARTAATSFTITSADATDTSVVAWHIVEPA